jgi:pimeloyl-ACP methyl ester carboxylesterase
VQLHIQEFGDAASPPLLLVHGTGAWSHTWVSNVDAMVQAGYRVIAVDLPPFGFSTRPADGNYNRAQQALRLLALMDALQLPPVTLLGHSYGGGPAAEAAMLQPQRLRHLILLDAAVGLRSSVEPQAQQSLAAQVFTMRPVRTTLIALAGTQPLFSEDWLRPFVYRKEVVTPQRTAIYQLPFAVSGYSAALGDWAYQFAGERGTFKSEQADGYKSLRMPVTLMWGEQDTITPLEQAKALKALMPQSTLVVLSGVGHIPQIEDVELFNSKLSAVLAFAKP